MNLNDLPKSRKEARALGLTLYFTGKPCVHGHIAARRLIIGNRHGANCEECQRMHSRNWKKKRSRGQTPDQVLRTKMRRRIEAHQAGEPYEGDL